MHRCHAEGKAVMSQLRESIYELNCLIGDCKIYPCLIFVCFPRVKICCRFEYTLLRCHCPRRQFSTGARWGERAWATNTWKSVGRRLLVQILERLATRFAGATTSYAGPIRIKVKKRTDCTSDLIKPSSSVRFGNQLK